MPQQGDHLPDQIVNEERYWRLRSNLQRFMEFADIRIVGGERFTELVEVGPDQGAIVAPTHTSWLDIIALGVANSERPMRFLGKQELWRLPYIGGLARDLGAFSVDRSDKNSRSNALDTSVRLVEQGEWVVMYPEGTRNTSRDRRSLGPLKTGVARAALQASGVTEVVPVGVGYRRGLVRRKAGLFHVGVVIGEPFQVERAETTEEQVQSVTAELRARLEELKGQAVDLAES